MAQRTSARRAGVSNAFRQYANGRPTDPHVVEDERRRHVNRPLPNREGRIPPDTPFVECSAKAACSESHHSPKRGSCLANRPFLLKQSGVAIPFSGICLVPVLNCQLERVLGELERVLGGSDVGEERRGGSGRPVPQDRLGMDQGRTLSSLPLDQFGDFHLVRQLGEPGAFGAAYEAARKGERCVVKIFHGELVDPIALARFQREVKAQRGTSHPNLVEYLDSGVTNWQGRACHWISMPYLEGRTLRDEIASKGGRLDPSRARSIAIQVARGLIALHREGIVHRDLKPSNIFLCTDGRVVILDFGIALFLDYTSLTERGRFVGTFGYAAPEQLIGDELPATDLYALGVVLYQAVTGRMPFTGRVLVELIHRIQTDDPEPPSSFCNDVPVSLEQLILWLLEKEPHRRPHDAAHLVDLLDGAAGTVVAHKPRPYESSHRPLLFIRAARERDPLVRACATACTPTAVVAPLTDPTARREARRVAGYANARFAADPQTFRLSNASFALSARMASLNFAPSDRITPYEPDHFRELAEARRFAYSVVDEQVDAVPHSSMGPASRFTASTTCGCPVARSSSRSRCGGAT